jgi:hypothetical protein
MIGQCDRGHHGRCEYCSGNRTHKHRRRGLHRVDIRALLRDPDARADLIAGAVRFLRALEGR